MTAGRNVNSISQDWGTPQKYVDAVKEVFGGEISLDPCSNKFSIVHAKTEYSLPEHDGLRESWNFPTIYINPPYGADRESGTTIKNWLQRCAEAHKKYDSEILALIPVASNTAHWKKYVWTSASAVCFLYDTRLRFLINGKDEGKGAPMSCAMVYWGKNYDKFFNVFIKYGAITDIRPLLDMRIGEVEKKDLKTRIKRNKKNKLLYDKHLSILNFTLQEVEHSKKDTITKF
jgi:hypothetical protein